MKTLPILIATVFATTALAQGQPTPSTPSPPSTPAQGAMSFEMLDRNADQKISKAEAAADRALNASFATLDADKDGSLNMAEFAKHVPLR